MLQHLKLLLAAVQAQGQFIQRRDEGWRRIGRAAEQFVRAALTDIQGKIEFAGVQLGQLGQAFAQGIQAGQARLQLGDMGSEGVQLALGIDPHRAHFRPLAIQRRGQLGTARHVLHVWHDPSPYRDATAKRRREQHEQRHQQPT
ncbi:hypothetical protein D3C80_1197010 [compost metagenome]